MSRLVRTAVFPVAGRGTRFLPATKAMPKEMLPIVNKPLVQYGVEEALEAGLFEIAFVTGRGKRTINDHFDISYELEHQIAGSDKEKHLVGIRNVIDRAVFSTTRQREMKGLGHAILTGQTLIGAEIALELGISDHGRQPPSHRAMLGSPRPKNPAAVY